MAAKKAENLSFEEALNELEQVVAALEQGNLPLEDALARFERGIKAARSGRERLEQAQQRIQQLIGDGDQAKLAPFASTGDSNDA